MASTKLITAEEMASIPNQKHIDLIDGKLVTAPFSGFWAAVVSARLALELFNFVEDRDLGLVTGGRCGYILSRNPDSVVGSSAAFVSKAAVPSIVLDESYIDVVPDLIIEIEPGTDDGRYFQRKFELYDRIQPPYLWLVDPVERTIEVRQRNCTSDLVRENGVLFGGDVLPGFSLQVSVLFKE